MTVLMAVPRATRPRNARALADPGGQGRPAAWVRSLPAGGDRDPLHGFLLLAFDSNLDRQDAVSVLCGHVVGVRPGRELEGAAERPVAELRPVLAFDLARPFHTDRQVAGPNRNLEFLFRVDPGDF